MIQTDEFGVDVQRVTWHLAMGDDSKCCSLAVYKIMILHYEWRSLLLYTHPFKMYNSIS